LRDYETTFVIDAHLQDEAIEKSVDKFLKFIENSGGKLGLIDRWGKRRLAYEIRKKQYGFYVCARYQADGSFIQNLEREFQLDEDVLRSLTILVPKSVLKDEKNNPRPVKAEENETDNENSEADIKKTESQKVDEVVKPEIKAEEQVKKPEDDKPAASEEESA